MKIKINDNSNPAKKVFVRVERDVRGLPLEELAKKMNLKKQLLDYHYDVNDEYHNVDDIYDAEDFVEELIEEYAGQNEDYYELAEQLLDLVRDDVIGEIYELDDEARDYEEVKRERY